MDKAAYLDKGSLVILLAQCVMIETGQNMVFFDAATQTVVEIVLRFVMNNLVAAGNQRLYRRDNGLCIGDGAFGGFIRTEQDAHGDGAGS